MSCSPWPMSDPKGRIELRSREGLKCSIHGMVPSIVWILMHTPPAQNPPQKPATATGEITA